MRCRLQVELLEVAGESSRRRWRRAARLRSWAYLSSTCLVEAARTCLTRRRRFAQMVVAAFDFLVNDNAVEAFLGRFGNEFFGQGDVLLAGEAKAVDDALDLVLGVFDALGDFDLLLAGEQGHLAHLLEVHAHRVVQDVQACFLVLFVRFGLLDPVHLRLVNDLDFQVAQLAVEIVQVRRAKRRRRAGRR